MNCEMPNTHTLDNAADDQFDPFLYRLYGHFARVCNEATDGKCHEGTRELAVHCQMSTGKVSSARQQLIEMGYIAIKEGAGDQPFETTLLEGVHPMNTNEEAVQEVNALVHDTNGTVHHMNDTVHEGESVHPMNTNADESASHTSADAVKQILKSKEIQEQEQVQVLKDKSVVGVGVNAGARNETLQPRPNVYRVYEANIGGLTGIIAEYLKAAVEEFGEEVVTAAIREAVEQNARKWKYIAAILDNWRVNGVYAPRPSKVSYKPPARAAPNGNGAHAPPAAQTGSDGFLGLQAAKQGGK